MHKFSLISLVLWIVPLVIQALLAWALWRRAAYKEFPWFLSLLPFKSFSDLVTLPLIYASPVGYFYVYWISQGLQRTLQILVIYELFGNLLFGVGSLTRMGKALFHVGAACLTGLSVFAALDSPGA